MAADVGVIRVKGRHQRDQAEQVEPQQGLGRNPTGTHCPRPSVLGEAERHSDEQDFIFKRLRCCVHESENRNMDYYYPEFCKIEEQHRVKSKYNADIKDEGQNRQPFLCDLLALLFKPVHLYH